MTTAAIKNVETGNVVGSVTDDDWTYQTDSFRKMVESKLEPNNAVSTITTTSFDSNSGTLSDGYTDREPGEAGFGARLVENLEYPYFLVDAEKKEELTL